jgi:uncharacterized DUF497 family protein
MERAWQVAIPDNEGPFRWGTVVVTDDVWPEPGELVAVPVGRSVIIRRYPLAEGVGWLGRVTGRWQRLADTGQCIYNEYMDVYSTLDGQGFVWDSEKASKNALQHGVRFEKAREAFLDPLARYEDASPEQEARQACIGLTVDYRLLYVVHVIREGDVLRLISARLAEPAERNRYENE